jgi:uncharacterized protein (TIGR03118 family)
MKNIYSPNKYNWIRQIARIPLAAFLLACVAPWQIHGATLNVAIQNFAFTPQSATVNPGDTVTWTQMDSAPHTSTSDANPPVWTSTTLSLGQTFSFTFNAPGQFAYHCSIHPFMQASVTVQGAANTPPTVSLASPTNGTTLTAPGSLTLSATASDPDGSVVSVEFLAGTNSLGTITTNPFSLAVSNLVAGTYTLTAKATDNVGATTTSSPVTVTVTAAVNQPPTVNLTSPTNGTTFAAPASFTLQATASDADGTVAQVDFFAGTNLLGTVISSPYVQPVSSLAAGTYVFTARATDNSGLAATSSPVTITVTPNVNLPPVVSLASPTNGTVLPAPGNLNLSATASDPDGSVVSVEFLAGTNSLGIVTASPFTLAVSNLATGTYTLTAKASDNAGAITVSSPVTVTVSAATNQPPTVTLTSPSNGTTYTAPATFLLQALASDVDGTITKVDFFSGTNLLRTVSASPYIAPVNNLGVGTYVITAQATDNSGAVTASGSVTVTVVAGQPPVVSLLNPTNGAVIPSPGSFTITAAASDPDGSIVKVEYFAGTNSLGAIAVAPYTLTVSNLSSGTHILTAQATDNSGAVTTSSQVTVTVDQLPVVSLSSPSNQSFFAPPASFALLAAATDPDGTIAQVNFFSGSTLLGTVVAPPYSWPLTNLPAGTYVFTAMAIDNAGLAGASSATTVNVGANQPPVVSLINPTNGTVVGSSANLTLTATATDPDGIVAKVEFLAGTNLLGTATAPPFSVFVNNLAAGTYLLAARATDNAGAVTTSSTVTVKVDRSPIVSILSPTNGTTVVGSVGFNLLAVTADVDGSVVKVDYYAGTSLLGTATASPYVVKVTNLAAGSYSITAKATDNDGISSTSSPVTIQVGGTPATPTVALTGPGKGAVFIAPANITLQATASETNGTISKVEFFNGTNSLGVASQSPYSLTWSNVPSGNYSLKATATDAQGTQATSASVAVVVTANAAYVQRNLVSDLPGLAGNTDTNLLNPWGIAFSPTGPFWLSDNHSGLSTVYDSTGAVQSLVVTVPPPASGTPPAAPTGIVFYGGTNFLVGLNEPAHFIFATEDGTISGWNTGSNAVLKADNSTSGAIYKGLTMATLGGSNFLYAADFHNAKIDVFDDGFNPVSLPGAFADSTIPAGYAPFGIQTIGTNIYVTYALQDADKHDDVSGAGHGYVNVFDPRGTMIKRFASAGALNSPWGIALAPAGFGPFSGALLIGNFADGLINAFDPATGSSLGSLKDSANNPIAIDGLWGLKFGNNGRGGDGARLYFAAGIAGSGQLEDHGLFGSISATAAAAVITLTSIQDNGSAVTINWEGGSGPYLLQKKTSLTDTNWFDILTTRSLYVTVPKDAQTGFYRVQDNATNIAIPFSVLLSGPTEVPATTSTATGSGLLTLEGMQLSYSISFSGLTGGAIAAHIHGPADAEHATGVLFPLNGAAGTAGTLSGSLTLTSDQLAAILTGMAYVNIHTPANPNGEIRGQVVPMRIPIMMSGSAEVPATTSTGTASGFITLIGNQMFYDIDYSGLSAPAVAAHIHGPADTTKPAGVLFPLSGITGTAGTLSGQQTLTADQLTNLLAGLTYANIHTTNNPNGEIRGQVLPWQFTVTMNGPSEVPPTTSTGTGLGTLFLSGNVLSYSINYSGLTGPAIAAHVHGPGDVTQSVGVLFPLNGFSGASGALSGTETLTADELADLITGNAYANIHTAINQNGEIRGQILLQY